MKTLFLLIILGMATIINFSQVTTACENDFDCPKGHCDMFSKKCVELPLNHKKEVAWSQKHAPLIGVACRSESPGKYYKVVQKTSLFQ